MAPKNTYMVTNGPNKMDLMLALFEPTFYDFVRVVKFTIQSLQHDELKKLRKPWGGYHTSREREAEIEIFDLDLGPTDFKLVIRSVERISEETWNIVAEDTDTQDVVTFTGYDTKKRSGFADIEPGPDPDPLDAVPDRAMHW